LSHSVRYDCKFFLGDRPCVHGGNCEGCDHYVPMGHRIVVIKLAAAGDVLRATSILPPLKRKYPQSHITWIADAPAVPLVERNPYVDRVMPLSFETRLIVGAERFDLALSLDKDVRAAALLNELSAREKLGFGLTRCGTIEPLNEGARYDFELGLSNEKKFHENKLTYPEIFCRIAELEYAGDSYDLVLPDSSIAYARRFIEGLAPSQPLVGLNVGAGDVFANKAWTPEGFAELARLVAGKLGGTALVLGGPEDRKRALRVLELAGGAAADGGLHEILDFAAVVGTLDALVTGDTMALHIAIALRVPVVAIFGPTTPVEIGFAGPGRKVVTSAECAPCYRRSCDVAPSCMDMIGTDEVLAALETLLASE